MPEKTVKVRVNAPFRVVHEGNPHTDGDTFTVPGTLAQEWERARWVERVTARAEANRNVNAPQTATGER